MVSNSREWYYAVSRYKYFQLILFLVFIGKFDQKSNFQPNWSKRGLIRAEYSLNVVFKSRDRDYIVSMYNYYHLTLFLVLIKKFDQKSNFHP